MAHQGARGRRTRLTAAAVAVGLATAGLAGAMLLVGPANGAVSIDPPGSPPAGMVELTGRVGPASDQLTSILYVVDATWSTSSQQGADCSGNGAVGPDDDLNGDSSIGDILDCEIAGVAALNRSLTTPSSLQVGVVAFANQAAPANLDPAGSTTFVPPGFTGGDPVPRIDTVTSSIVRGHIGRYEPSDLGGTGSKDAFDNAITVALSTLRSQPEGDKWIMFFSDGQSPIDDGVLHRLERSGVRLRSFAIGSGPACARSGSLFRMAAATSESCRQVPDPARLAAALTGSQPDAVSGVRVEIADVAVAATVDAVGGWRARFRLGAGTYTATATAVMTSGAVERTRYRFTVVPAAGGPPVGEVHGAPGSLEATAIRVDRPAPTRRALPPRVTGRVGRAVRGLTLSRSLLGARVLLQARRGSGAPWTTVRRGRVARKGRFALEWRPRSRFTVLRVVLDPVGGLAGSAAAVPESAISACTVTRRGTAWSVECRTTARHGSRVQLLAAGRGVVSSTRVRHGSFRLRGTGRVDTHTVVVRAGRRGRVRLGL